MLVILNTAGSSLARFADSTTRNLSTEFDSDAKKPCTNSLHRSDEGSTPTGIAVTVYLFISRNEVHTSLQRK